jgi:flagellar export protein FliJ
VTRTERFKPVVKHTDKKEKQALEAMAFSQGELEIEQNRLGQLETYKKEYLQNHAQKNQVYSAIELQEYIRFMAQLDRSIEQQGEVIELRKKELEYKRQSWQTTHMESRVMHKVVDNLQRQEQVIDARNEQKQMDELSQRKIQKS